jgi:hypothetical protein
VSIRPEMRQQLSKAGSDAVLGLQVSCEVGVPNGIRRPLGHACRDAREGGIARAVVACLYNEVSVLDDDQVPVSLFQG